MVPLVLGLPVGGSFAFYGWFMDGVVCISRCVREAGSGEE